MYCNYNVGQVLLPLAPINCTITQHKCSSAGTQLQHFRFEPKTHIVFDVEQAQHADIGWTNWRLSSTIDTRANPRIYTMDICDGYTNNPSTAWNDLTFRKWSISDGHSTWTIKLDGLVDDVVVVDDTTVFVVTSSFAWIINIADSATGGTVLWVIIMETCAKFNATIRRWSR